MFKTHNILVTVVAGPPGENGNILHKRDFAGENGLIFLSRIGKLRGPGLCEEISCIRNR